MAKKKRNVKRRVLVPAKVEITPGGKIRVFVSAKVARRLKKNPTPTGDLLDEAWQAGLQWGKTGADNSGVANARVRRYGFIKWWNNKSPESTRGVSKGLLEKDFNRGYRLGKTKQ